MIPGVIIKEGRCQLSFTGMHEEEEREIKCSHELNHQDLKERVVLLKNRIHIYHYIYTQRSRAYSKIDSCMSKD